MTSSDLTLDPEQIKINGLFKDKIVTQILVNNAYKRATSRLLILNKLRSQYHESVLQDVISELKKSGVEGSVFMDSRNVWCFVASGVEDQKPEMKIVEMSI